MCLGVAAGEYYNETTMEWFYSDGLCVYGPWQSEAELEAWRPTAAQERFHKAMGVKLGDPVDIGTIGQSNAQGRGASAAEVAFEPDIQIGNNSVAPTLFLDPPVWDAAPFDTGGTAALPTQNPAIHMANELRRSGLIHPSSPIRLIPSCRAANLLRFGSMAPAVRFASHNSRTL